MIKPYFLIAMAVAAQSCMNPVEVTSDVAAERKVEFIVEFSDFDASTKASATEAGVKQIEYVLYSANGTQVKHKTVNAGDAIEDVITDGGYTAFFVAHSAADGATIDGDVVSFSRPSETYAGSVDFTVSESDPITKTATLGRVSGRIEVVAQDVVPANASRIALNYTNVHNGINLKTMQGAGAANADREFSFSAANVGKPNVKFSLNAFHGTESVDVAVSVYNATDKRISRAEITGASVQASRLERYTGNVFTQQSVGGFPIEINTDWGEIIEIEF